MHKWFGGLSLVVFLAVPAFAQQAAAPIVGVTMADSGDTAWVMVSTMFVLLLALPGLALYFSAQAATKQGLAIAAQALAILAAVSLAWVAIGYSLAFGEGTPLLGGTDNLFFANLAELRTDTTVPESGYALYEMALAIVAAVLLSGGGAGRARFGWMLSLAALWSLCVYVPVAHWLWGNGWLAELGAHDFAGGIVIAVAAGVSALVIAVMLRPRDGHDAAILPPQNPVMVIVGGGLIWAGWLACTGGAALAASDDAAAALINAHLSGCAAALVWALVERLRSGEVSISGLVMGGISGLAAASASAGYIGPFGAIMLGAIAGFVSALCAGLRAYRAVDDSSNVFAVFGLSGLVGAVLFPVFVPILGGPGFEQGVTLSNQLLVQLIAVGAVGLWAGIVTLVMGLAITLVIPMRVTETAVVQEVQ